MLTGCRLFCEFIPESEMLLDKTIFHPSLIFARYSRQMLLTNWTASPPFIVDLFLTIFVGLVKMLHSVSIFSSSPRCLVSRNHKIFLSWKHARTNSSPKEACREQYLHFLHETKPTNETWSCGKELMMLSIVSCGLPSLIFNFDILFLSALSLLWLKFRNAWILWTKLQLKSWPVRISLCIPVVFLHWHHRGV